MTDIPHAVLSDEFGKRIGGRRLLSAVFLTYRFEPAFFEQQVLPAFLNCAVSQAEAVRLVQLEDRLRVLPGDIAVYYDMNGLDIGDGTSAKLDIRRIPIRHDTGIFHPKNVLLLLEDQKADEKGHHARTLLVASLSANLTRAGWWENVECCHMEEIAEFSASRLRGDLRRFLRWIRRKAKVDREQRALGDILAFLDDIQPRIQRSKDGILYTHFFAKNGSFPDFLDEVAGTAIKGACLEVISPYFDDSVSCTPLGELIDRFRPSQVRVFLPRDDAGAALCRRDFHDSVKSLKSTSWAHLPKDIQTASSGGVSRQRTVHAKVYRFFTRTPKREILFVGSVNLTGPAHKAGGNVESGFLVDRIPPQRPDFWLVEDDRPAKDFATQNEHEELAPPNGTKLSLVYHWDRHEAKAWWDGKAASGALVLSARNNGSVGVIEPLKPGEWTRLPDNLAKQIEEALSQTSIFLVSGEADVPLTLLVQEEGMSQKPSLLAHLSTEDILHYWSLLSPEQRVAFLESRSLVLGAPAIDGEPAAMPLAAPAEPTMFDRFAGIFHAFACLERGITEALDAGNEKEADFRLFGCKYDSLGSLLDRIAPERSEQDVIERYVMLLSARQLATFIERKYPDYWTAHEADANRLKARLSKIETVREELTRHGPLAQDGFLTWYEKWFLTRAEREPEISQ